ncbi:MAG: universal stress protein [Candidatus Tectimicrobiota bacterium]
MSFHRLLVPTDFSTHAAHAVVQACALAAQDKAQVLLVHVIPTTELDPTMLAWWQQHAQEVQAAAAQQLRRLAAEQAVPVETLVIWGHPPSEICRLARERASDLIVMSTHGRTGLSHVLLGSVAERVVRHAPCAVLIVRALPHAAAPSGGVTPP